MLEVVNQLETLARTVINTGQLTAWEVVQALIVVANNLAREEALKDAIAKAAEGGGE